jgi:hypothetical protein
MVLPSEARKSQVWGWILEVTRVAFFSLMCICRSQAFRQTNHLDVQNNVVFTKACSTWGLRAEEESELKRNSNKKSLFDGWSLLLWSTVWLIVNHPF